MSERKPEEAENVVEIGVRVERVWEAVTTPEGLRCFLAEHVDIVPGVGGHIQIGWGDQMLDPATIDVWEPNRRICTHGNGVAEEWVLEAKGGSTIVRLVYSGYGDADWDEMYDAFDATGALVLDLLVAWLDEHDGTPPTNFDARAHVRGDRAAAWATALGRGGLAIRADPESLEPGDRVRLALAGGSPLDARLTMYDLANEALFSISELDGARLLLMVRTACDGRSTVTLGLISYGLESDVTEQAHRRLELTAAALENT